MYNISAESLEGKVFKQSPFQKVHFRESVKVSVLGKIQTLLDMINSRSMLKSIHF